MINSARYITINNIAMMEEAGTRSLFVWALADDLTGLLAERKKDTHIQHGHGFKIKYRPYCPTDGVTLHHAVVLHLIDDTDNLGNAHANVLEGFLKAQLKLIYTE